MQAERRRWIDVREYPEFASGSIEGSELVPLGSLERACADWDRTQPLTMICRTDRRSVQAQELLLARGFEDVEILAGGMEEWRERGRPMIVVARRPWSLERQVRVGAGSMVVISLLLARLVSAKFLWWTGFVGCGLVFAGVTDICMMAVVLGRMPWNRATSGPAQC